MHNDHEPGSENYEQSDVRLKIIVICGLVVSGLTFVGFAASYGIVKGLNMREPATEYEAHPLAGEHNEWDTEVRLQPNPEQSLAAHLEEQTREVRSFGTISEEPAIYRIPVEKAMEHVVQHGLPEFETPKAEGEPVRIESEKSPEEASGQQ